MTVWLRAMGNMSSTNAHRERPTGIAIKAPPLQFHYVDVEKAARPEKLSVATCCMSRLATDEALSMPSTVEDSSLFKGVKVLLKL